MSNFEARIGKNIQQYSDGQFKVATYIARTQLSIVPIGEAQVKILEGRDATYYEHIVPKKPNRYIHEDFPVMTEGNLARVAVRAGSTDLGYGVFGVYKEEGRRVGELAMVRVAPGVKGLGIGSAIVNYGISQILDRGVDALRMEVADRSGKIDSIAGRLGFKMLRSTPGIKGNSIVERPVSEAERAALQEKTQISAILRLQQASEQPNLWDKVSAIDKDNPLKMDVVGSIEGRVRESNYKRAGVGFDIVYFGHLGASLRIALVGTSDNNQAIEAAVKGITPDHARSILRSRVNGFSVVESDFGLGEGYGGSVFRGQVANVKTALEDLVPLTKLSVDLIHQVAAEKYVGG